MEKAKSPRQGELGISKTLEVGAWGCANSDCSLQQISRKRGGFFHPGAAAPGVERLD